MPLWGSANLKSKLIGIREPFPLLGMAAKSFQQFKRTQTGLGFIATTPSCSLNPSPFLPEQTKNQNQKSNQMKTTLTTSEAANILFNDKNAGWSYAGARALVEYLEELEQDTGEEMEMDFVAIRCDFSEYDSALECAVDYGWSHEASILDDDDNIRPDDEVLEENNERALRWLQDRTQVVEFDGGIIVANF